MHLFIYSSQEAETDYITYLNSFSYPPTKLLSLVTAPFQLIVQTKYRQWMIAYHCRTYDLTWKASVRRQCANDETQRV